MGNFIRDCLEKSKRNTTLKDVYDKYSEWCRENGFGTENKGNLRDELKAKGIFAEITRRLPVVEAQHGSSEPYQVPARVRAEIVKTALVQLT